VLAARESEIDAAKEQIASLQTVLEATGARLAEHERLLGTLKGVMVAIKRLLVPAR